RCSGGIPCLRHRRKDHPVRRSLARTPGEVKACPARHWDKLRARRGASALAARGVRGCTLRAARALATKYGEANWPSAPLLLDTVVVGMGVSPELGPGRAMLALRTRLDPILPSREWMSPIAWTNGPEGRARMLIDDSGRSATPHEGNRRDFLKRVGLGAAAAAAVGQGLGIRRAAAQSASSYPDWIPPSPKTPKRGGTLTRASPWDPPVLDPRLTNSVGLFQMASLVGSRLVRFPFTDEAPNTADLTLKGDLAESWSGSTDQRVWTFKLRQGVKWHNVAPLNGRELVSADFKYCFEQYAKEGVQAFTFQEIEGMETPDKHTVRIHLKTPNTMFPQNLAEAVSVIF